MTDASSGRRYQDILRNIAQRRPFGSAREVEKPRTPQDRALDLLNAFDTLADLSQRDFKLILCYGPRTFRGPAWTGVALWYHSKGYHGYQTLRLLGIWAHYLAGDIMLSIGRRALPYQAPVYDPGVYRVAIQNNFRIYYDDDCRPPAEGDRLLYRTPFKLEERLNHRQALAETLQGWTIEVEAG